MTTNKPKEDNSSSTMSKSQSTRKIQAKRVEEISQKSVNPVDQNIRIYNEYRNSLHGIIPAWELPDLDDNVKISFPEISD